MVRLRPQKDAIAAIGLVPLGRQQVRVRRSGTRGKRTEPRPQRLVRRDIVERNPEGHPVQAVEQWNRTEPPRV
jgi:hypothetical protein